MQQAGSADFGYGGGLSDVQSPASWVSRLDKLGCSNLGRQTVGNEVACSIFSNLHPGSADFG